MGHIPKKNSREEETKEIIDVIIARNVPKLMINAKLKIQKAPRTLAR